MSDVFGRRLRAYRKLKHWTQVDFANELGVSVAIVGAMERGTRLPSESLLQQICRLLNVTPEELSGSEHWDHGALVQDAT